jgi:ribosomal protein S20
MRNEDRVRRGPQRVTETSDYVAMMTRIITAFGDRVASDPAALAHLRDLQDVLADQVNRGIFEANKGRNHCSQNEMAAILGISRQAIAKRIGLGETVYARTWEARGAGVVVRVADIRTRRAQLLADADVPDRTGSALERRGAAS